MFEQFSTCRTLLRFFPPLDPTLDTCSRFDRERRSTVRAGRTPLRERRSARLTDIWDSRPVPVSFEVGVADSAPDVEPLRCRTLAARTTTLRWVRPVAVGADYRAAVLAVHVVPGRCARRTATFTAIRNERPLQEVGHLSPTIRAVLNEPVLRHRRAEVIIGYVRFAYSGEVAQPVDDEQP